MKQSSLLGPLVLGLGFAASCAHPSTQTPQAPAPYQYAAPTWAPPIAPPPPMAPPRPAFAFAALPPPISLAQLQQAVAAGMWTVGGAIAGLLGHAALPGFAPAPTPAAQAAAKQAPCGAVAFGNRVYRLDCKNLHVGMISQASHAVVPRATLHQSLHEQAAAPIGVNHRTEGLEGPVRDQGVVGDCTAFAFSGAVDHALATTAGTPGFVAVLHAWSRYHYPAIGRALPANVGQGIAAEATWPYNQQLACSWSDPEDTDCESQLHVGHSSPDPALIARADAADVARIANATQIETDTTTLKETISNGNDVLFGMQVSQQMLDLQGLNLSGMSVIPDFDPSNSVGSHAATLVGYQTQADGDYFLIKNSWSTEWGDGGYAWVHATTLTKNIEEAYVVQAAPLGATPPPQQPPAPAPPAPAPAQTCPNGTAPDSVTGQCAPPCPDGSPRHQGACPVASQCPAGSVNLYGICIPGAPPGGGTDPASGVTFQCGIAGCTYYLPAGQGGCTQGTCTFSCPAPSYILTSGPQGLGCTG